MDCAVLFLIFNRPDTTAQVFEAIRQAKPRRLYVAADGPRAGRVDEMAHCEAARRIATAVDWECEVKTLFRAENLGCRRAVSQALDWFFAAEECGIILEDDCLPSRSWFPFAEEMLARYREDERIMCIAANHFHGNAHALPYSYFFSAYAHCWGWASWRRAWAHYDHDMAGWPALRETGFPTQIADGSRLVQRHWIELFDIAYAGVQVDSWAYRWLFSCWAQSGLTVLPAKNLVINLGVGQEATHTHSVNPVISRIRNEELKFPLRHPPTVVRDVGADNWESVHVYGISNRHRFRHWLRHLPVVGDALVMLRNAAKAVCTGARHGSQQ